MTRPPPSDQLRAAAQHLAPRLAAEIERLYALEAEHSALGDRARDLANRLHAASVVTGELRGQLATAQSRLAEVNLPEHAKARRDAVLLGDGFVRITSAGGGRYDVTHLPAGQVVILQERR